MMKKIYLMILILTGFNQAFSQQDSQFTQYVFNGIHINPAYAGYKDDLYMQSFYRSQWVGVDGAPISFSIAGDMSVNNGNVGLGLIVSSDRLGAQNNLTAYANYAYRIQVGYDEQSRLSFGIAAGFMQLGLDGNRLSGIDEGDEAIFYNNQTKLLPDARAGIYYSDEKFFAGFSATNLLAKYAARGNTSNLLVPVPQPHFYLTGGALFPLAEGLMIKPTFLLKDDTKGPTSLDLNSFFLLNEKVWLGAFYRTTVTLYDKDYLQNGLNKKSALGAMFELYVSPSLRIGYSYDYSLNALQNYNFGSHEISVGVYLHRSSTERRQRLLRCYDF
ncbi:MAG: type IX secretion system membrane protein PorP/SprF [Pedobacter sp.]|nr:MAG: type IX secretion system membrane protein PorP/SprF [Pedobacter sp.]